MCPPVTDESKGSADGDLLALPGARPGIEPGLGEIAKRLSAGNLKVPLTVRAILYERREVVRVYGARFRGEPSIPVYVQGMDRNRIYVP